MIQRSPGFHVSMMLTVRFLYGIISIVDNEACREKYDTANSTFIDVTLESKHSFVWKFEAFDSKMKLIIEETWTMAKMAPYAVVQVIMQGQPRCWLRVVS